MRVLIADDDPMMRSILGNALAVAGYEVETAENGTEAIEKLREGRARLVICDWEMPNLNGLEMCRTLREEDYCGYVYVILLTGHTKQSERIEGLSAGADDFMSKPFDMAELLARVRIGERVLSMETRDVALFALARLTESRDPETGGHLDRVRGYSRLLAQQLVNVPEFSEEATTQFIRLIYLTSPLHDIGKVGIPDAVLLKAGTLNEHEFEIMKTHTQIGADTLNAALRQFPGIPFLRMARDIAASHHERFDGTGYPAGLKGNDIPLCARIVALADVYDALTSKRVYKDAYDHVVAKDIITKESGKHFDPIIVEAFLGCEEQWLTIWERYSVQASETSLVANV